MKNLDFRTMLALLGGAAIVAGAAAPVAAQPTPLSLLCASAKQKAHGKTAAGVLNCHSKAAKAGTTVDTLCIDKAEAKWVAAHAKAELKGGCAVEAQSILFGGTDAGEVQGLYDLIVDETFTLPDDPPAGIADQVVPLLRPNLAINKCQSDKLKNAGKFASGLLGCHSKAAKKGTPVDQVKCVDKVRAKLQGAFAKAETKPPCDTTGDVASIQAAIESFVEQALVGMPRNDGCGSGFVITPETCDDGNVVNTDNCPSDCTIATCTPNAGSDDPWAVSFTAPKNFGAVRVFVDYPEDKLSILGSGDVSLGGDIDTILGEPFTVASFNDANHGLTGVLAEGLASPTGFGVLAGDLFTIHFETCNGAPAASAGDFTCTVIDAADPAGKVLTGVTCNVN